MPRRGAVALVTTILAVVLLLSFKTGDLSTLGHGGLPTNALIGAPPVATAAPVAVVGGPTPDPAATTPPNSGRSGPTATPRKAAGPPAPAATPPPSPAGPAGQAVSGTFTGQAVDTPYGTVQIALVVQSGKITDVQELQLPSDRSLSQQISAQAGPMLRTQVLQAQSDNINGVSGASYTSYGFYESLQSALAQMH